LFCEKCFMFMDILVSNIGMKNRWSERY
jgi:hypothetical protein